MIINYAHQKCKFLLRCTGICICTCTNIILLEIQLGFTDLREKNIKRDGYKIHVLYILLLVIDRYMDIYIIIHL